MTDTMTKKPLSETELNALYQMGYNLYQQTQYTEAGYFFAVLTIYRPYKETYFSALAACQKMTKSYEQAISNYAMAYMLASTQLEYALHIAECQLALGYTTSAQQTLQPLLENENVIDSHIANKAQALMTLLKTKDAAVA
jgi:type III secretion system low calcium response chaperone LcrH/SycD